MSKRVSKKEETLYEPIIKALRRVFTSLGDCHLEVTAKKNFSDKLKKAFDDVALYIMNVEGFFPDITGFVKTEYSTDIITVEVKPNKPTFKHIFQAKEYAQIFNAKYALLISTQSISEVRRRLILKRNDIIRYPRGSLIIARFDEEMGEFEIDNEFYYFSLPEPFKSHGKALQAENLKVLDTVLDLMGDVNVFVSNVSEVPIKIVEVGLEGRNAVSSLTKTSLVKRVLNVTFEPNESKYIKFSKPSFFNVGKPIQIELITEIGKKFIHKTILPILAREAS